MPPPYPSTFLGLSYYFYISIFLFTDLRGMNPAGNSGAAIACSGEGLNGTFFERCKGHPPFSLPPPRTLTHPIKVIIASGGCWGRSCSFVLGGFCEGHWALNLCLRHLFSTHRPRGGHWGIGVGWTLCLLLENPASGGSGYSCGYDQEARQNNFRKVGAWELGHPAAEHGPPAWARS